MPWAFTFHKPLCEPNRVFTVPFNGLACHPGLKLDARTSFKHATEKAKKTFTNIV